MGRRVKDLTTDVCNMKINGFENMEIAEMLGVDVNVVDDIIEPIPEDIRAYAEMAADLDADFYGRN